MKAKNNFLSAPFALKLVGFILVFSSLLDYLFLVNGLGDFKDKQALGTGITQLVDRGVIPMIGVALILTAYWLERLADMPARNSKLFRFVALDLARTQIKEQADKAEGQVEQQVQQRQAELTNLVKDTKQFDEQLKQMGEAIANSGNNQMPPEQLAQLKQLEKDLKEIKANPTALQNKAKESREQLLNRIRDEKQKAEQQVNSQAWKASAKTGLNSLILSVGYLIISWVGLSEMGLFSGDAKTRRAPNNNP
jgi:ABC-type multidrug transport system fused ATPase/permease subunit